MATRKFPKEIKTREEKRLWNNLFGDKTINETLYPQAVMLVRWHLIANKCIEDINSETLQLAYTLDSGALQAMPQLQTLKTASAEIRALSKALSLDEPKEEKHQSSDKGKLLKLVIGDRQQKKLKQAEGT